MNKKELVMKYRAVVSLACSVHNLQNVFRIKHKCTRGGVITLLLPAHC